MATVSESLERRGPSAAAGCPLCGGDASVRFVKRGHPISDCAACGHRFAPIAAPVEGHVASTYDDSYFTGGAAGYRNYLGEEKLLVAHGRRYGRLLTRFAPPGRILDAGAAAGFVLKGFLEAGWRGEGVEPNDSVAAHARDALGLAVRTGTLESFRSEAPFDAVSLIQVIAHFVDPVDALLRVRELLLPGGLCLVETWNVRSWTARLFGSGWHEYSPPSVLHWFSPQRLGRLFEEHGFREVGRGRPRKWLDGEHAKSLLRHALPDNLPGRMLYAPARLVPDRLPIPYPSEDLFWAVYRKE